MLITAIAGIIIAGIFAVALPTAAFADIRGGNTDPGSGERTAISTVERGTGLNHQSAIGGNANSGNGGDANGGNACLKADCRS
jgi:hypothetical protein